MMFSFTLHWVASLHNLGSVRPGVPSGPLSLLTQFLIHSSVHGRCLPCDGFKLDYIRLTVDTGASSLLAILVAPRGVYARDF